MRRFIIRTQEIYLPWIRIFYFTHVPMWAFRMLSLPFWNVDKINAEWAIVPLLAIQLTEFASLSWKDSMNVLLIVF